MVLRRQTVESKDVQEVIELPVHIAAHCDVRALQHWHVNHRRQRCKQRLYAQQDGKRVAAKFATGQVSNRILGVSAIGARTACAESSPP